MKRLVALEVAADFEQACLLARAQGAQVDRKHEEIEAERIGASGHLQELGGTLVEGAG